MVSPAIAGYDPPGCPEGKGPVLCPEGSRVMAVFSIILEGQRLSSALLPSLAFRPFVCASVGFFGSSLPPPLFEHPILFYHPQGDMWLGTGRNKIKMFWHFCLKNMFKCVFSNFAADGTDPPKQMRCLSFYICTLGIR